MAKCPNCRRKGFGLKYGEICPFGVALRFFPFVLSALVDPKTHVTLWSFPEYVRGAILLGNRDKNFDPAMNTVVGRMKQRLDPPAAAADAPRK